MCMAVLLLTACTKSEEFHPEMGYGDYEVITVKPESVHIRYFWKDMERHSRTFFVIGSRTTAPFMITTTFELKCQKRRIASTWY